MVALPVFVLRKVFLTDRRSSAASPLGIVKSALAQNSTRVATITYLLSAICALLVHVFLAYTGDGHRGDPKLTLFVKSKTHVYIARNYERQVCIPMVTCDPKSQTPILVAAVGLLVPAVFTTLSLATASLVFGAARLALPILYKIPFVSIFLRPFTAHFLKGSWTLSLPLLHIPLLFRAWFLGFSTFLTWEASDVLFEGVVSETSSVSTQTSDPNITLVSGIASTDRIFSFFAYSELKELATDESASASARRTALFGDQKNALNVWTHLARESLLLLGRDYQLFLRRGKPAPPPPVPEPVKPKVVVGPQIPTTPLVRQRVFKTTTESPGQAALDALSSDGPIAKVLEAGADATHVPELFRSVETRVLTSPIAEEAKKNVQSAKGLGGKAKDGAVSFIRKQASKYVPGPVKEIAARVVAWTTNDRLSKVVEASLPYRELDVVVVGALSSLTCASLTEDRYGVVQRDIPKILEALISFLSAIEEYQMEIRTKHAPSMSTTLSVKEREEQEALAIEVHKAQEVLGYVGDGLKEGIVRIVRKFGDKLLAFKFPPRIAQKLQAFLDYS
ncbi:hypothetical protein NLJ89_g2337 [Agrocybe chaxingu]|uniref:Nucleoporin protein Ndc1-Nup n=1 Tax=Agrocybe chaxingu TaxID=84603 RepID=A0A9W8K7P1_9AGAR|nr:hypothetical protein NLJ89_g2337 [Agrocybe chaxingu]